MLWGVRKPDREKNIPVTGKVINIFFIIKDKPLPESRQDVISWATQNSAAMKRCL